MQGAELSVKNVGNEYLGSATHWMDLRDIYLEMELILKFITSYALIIYVLNEENCIRTID